MLDVRAEYVYTTTKNVVDKLIGDENSELHQLKIYLQVLNHSYKLITQYNFVSHANEPMALDEKVLHSIFKFWEKMLDKQMGQCALYQFFWIANEGSLVQVLLSIGTFSMTQGYSTKVLHFFNKLFQASEKSEKDLSLEQLCSSIDDLATVDEDRLQGWLSQVLLGTPELQRSASVSSSNIPTPTNATNKYVYIIFISFFYLNRCSCFSLLHNKYIYNKASKIYYQKIYININYHLSIYKNELVFSDSYSSLYYSFLKS